VRRLLVRTLVVLGGAVAVTVIGWLLSAGSANAAQLPSVPSVLSGATGATDQAADQLSTPDLTATVKSVLKPDLDSALPAPPSLDTVTKQVTGVSDRVTPAVVPAVSLAPHKESAPEPVTTHAVAHTVTRPAAPVRSLRHTVSVAYRHVSTTAAVELPGARHQVPPAPRVDTDRGVGHHTPQLPPLQPAGSSSDSSAHGLGGLASGPGSTLVPFTHVLGDGLNLAGPPSTPRPGVAPGQQPGTSPD
jgi:hypothetical protein